MTSKRFVIGLSLGVSLVLVLAVSAWLLISDAILVAALKSRLEEFAEFRIDYQGDARITRTLTPTLSVDHLAIADRNGRFRIETGSFQLQVDLAKLLFGQLDIPLLSLGDTRITVLQLASDIKSPVSDRDAGWPFAGLTLKPVVHQLQVGAISWVSENQELRLPTVAIDEFAFNLTPENDTLTVTAEVELGRENFIVTAAMPDLYSALRKQSLAFSATAKNERISLGADGHATFDKPKPAVEAAIQVGVGDLSKFETGVDGLVIPGALTADARLAGNYDQLALSDMSVQWDGPDASQLTLGGRIDNVAQLNGAQLQVTGTLNHPHWLAPLFPASVGALKKITLNTQVTGARALFGFHNLDLHVLTGQGLDFSLRGQCNVSAAGTDLQPQNIDLQLAFSAPTTQAARALLFEQVPELGAMSGTAELRAITGTPALQNIVIKTHDSEGIDVDLSGNIARLSLEPDQPISGFDLGVTMHATSAATLAKRLGLNFTVSGPTTLAYRIEGDTQALALKQIKLSAGEAKSILITAQGQLLLGRWDQDDPLQSVDLTMTANSRTTALLGSLIDTQLPELGALSMRARLHTVAGEHRADDLRIHTQKGVPVSVSLLGSIDKVLLMPRLALQGVSLEANATASDTAALNALFNLQEVIPAIGAFKARAAVSGSDQALLIKDLSVTAGLDTLLLVNAEGRLGTLSAVNHWRLRDADVRIKAQSSGSRAFARTMGFKMPELGPIQAQATLMDKDKMLALESARIQIGKAAAPAVKASGFVTDLFATNKTHWDAQLNIDGRTLAAFADQRRLPDLGSLIGSMVIANDDGTLGIDALELKTTQVGALSASVTGSFGDFKNPSTLLLDASLSARDLQLLGALFDQDWPVIGPVRFDGKISHAEKGTELAVNMRAGEIRIDAGLMGQFDTTPPRISGSITAQNFYLPKKQDDSATGRKAPEPDNKPIFSLAPIDYGWLKKADLDLTIDLSSFNKEKSGLESATFSVALKAGQLSIEPARLVYPKGRLDLSLQLDAQDPPQIKFMAYGEGLDPWQALDIQQLKKNYNADMDVDVALSTTGISEHELAANANGDVYITMKNGKLRRELLDIVLVDMVGWTIGKTIREKYYDVDCGIADYSIEQGVMTTKALLIDTKNVAISGQGRIDLGREQVDYALLPKKKSRVAFKADPVKITGALNNPNISVLPWKSAVTTYGGLIFAPYIFVGLSATDYLSGALGIGPKSSPCEEYEKLRKSPDGRPDK